MSRLSLCLGVILALVLSAVSPEAQTAPDTLVWEPVGNVEDGEWLAFDADTLYAGVGLVGAGRQESDIVSLTSGDDEWAVVEMWSRWYSGLKDIWISPDRILFTLSNTKNLRRFQAWDGESVEVRESANTTPYETPSGTLVVGMRKFPLVAARSTDGGLTWSDHGGGDAIPSGMTPVDLVLLPPSPEAPLGRILAAGFGGLSYSDDDGVTWAPTQFFADGPAFSAWAAARIEPGPWDGGHAGEVLVVLEENAGGSGVYRSADGLSWERVSDFPGVDRYQSRFLASPDGAVYLYETRRPSANYHRGRAVWRTTDGGATWASVGPVWEGWSAVPTEIVVGPEGRLWASAEGRDPDPMGRVGGVFRTMSPVVAVASESEPPAASGAGLSVSPNPTSGAVRIEVETPTPEAVEVVIVILDARGREVARVASGGVAEVDTSAWPAGVYVVRAAVGREVATVRFTVVR